MNIFADNNLTLPDGDRSSTQPVGKGKFPKLDEALIKTPLDPPLETLYHDSESGQILGTSIARVVALATGENGSIVSKTIFFGFEEQVATITALLLFLEKLGELLKTHPLPGETVFVTFKVR